MSVSLSVFFVSHCSYRKVTRLATSVASTAGSSAQAQSGAVSLDMAETLAVVALLCCGLSVTACASHDVVSLLSVVRG